MWRRALILLMALGIGLRYVAIAQAPPENSRSHENPPQKEELQELWRLRSEGVAHFESGVGLKKALATFESALQHKPGSAVELFNVGAPQRKLGDLASAQETLLSAVKADKS